MKTLRAYKLMKIDDAGHLHFPFAMRDVVVRIGEWMRAHDASTIGKDGKRATTLEFRGGSKGRMAPRPGFHCGDIPYASHIGIGGNQQQHEYIGDADVWCEVELRSDIDYQAEADANGKTVSGKINRVIADIRDHVPANGTYRYKTNPNMKGTWIIGGDMRIKRIMYDDEVLAMSDAYGMKRMPRLSGIKPRSWTDWLNALNYSN